jgi:hypothetical protein
MQLEALINQGIKVDATTHNNIWVCTKNGNTAYLWPKALFWKTSLNSNRKIYGMVELLEHLNKGQVKSTKNPEINNQGLTVRDYFATHAMEGMVTDVVIDGQQIARMAYELADAMMKEREVRRG